ncbi:MAG: anaerobic glycerol-3-phosphate dehydrogenase subunit GlpB [Bacillota bacterium]
MMNKNTEMLVIGAGLSGLTAAAVAADQGKKVVVVASGVGVLGLTSGCIDLWGYSLNHPGEVSRDPVGDIKRLVEINTGHPYARVKFLLAESLDFFQRACSESGCIYVENQGKNWLIPTALGTLRPTFLAPASMAVGPLKNYKKIVIAGFRELKDFYPGVIAANLRLNADLACDCVIEPVWVDAGGGEVSPIALARRLESPEIISGVVRQVKSYIADGTVLFFPAVLGERGGSQTLRLLSGGLGCPVFEVAGVPPSVPGQRLQNALMLYLKRRGVEVILGSKVTGVNVAGNRCNSVIVSGGVGLYKITASSYVLATGSFVGGGLEANFGGIRETVFNLPVSSLQGEFCKKDFLDKEGHPFSKLGISVNYRLQALDSRGNTMVDNLVVAGSNLAGCNYPIEKCGSGVAVATGYMAGKLAGEVRPWVLQN